MSKVPSPRLGRRVLLSVGAVAGAAAVIGAPGRAAAELPSQRGRVEALFAGLRGVDGALGGWRVEAVYPVNRGAIPVLLRTPAGVAYQVDVLRRDEASAAPAHTERYALFIANRGDGRAATDEVQGRGAQVLAAALARREAEMVAQGEALPELASFAERARVFPDGLYSIRS